MRQHHARGPRSTATPFFSTRAQAWLRRSMAARRGAMSVVVVLALLGSVGLEPVGAAGASGPDPSLVGIWNLGGTSVTISIGGQKAIDPLCEPDMYCITTPNTSSMGGIFFAEDISLTANGAGNWVYTCIGCTGWETITGHFTGSTKFTGKAVPGPLTRSGSHSPSVVIRPPICSRRQCRSRSRRSRALSQSARSST